MSSKDKNLFGAILLGIAGFLMFYFTLPSYDQTKQIGSAVKERKALFESRSKIMDNIVKLKTSYDANKSQIDKISIIIPSQKRIPELVSSFENMAGSTGLALTTLNISDNSNTETDKEVKTLTISAKLVGTYDSYRNFLATVETNQRLIDVGASKVFRNEDTGTLLIELTSRVYVLTNK